jgi:cell division protein FtsB
MASTRDNSSARYRTGARRSHARRSTTSTHRSATVKRPASPPAASDSGRSRLGDLTRPIAIERRITKRRRSTILLGIVAVAIAGAIAAALFILPVQTYLGQNEALERSQAQLDQLESVNNQLQLEVDRLRTESGIREAAREEIGFSEPGEQRLTVLPFPDITAEFPEGWPYDLVDRVLELRGARN